MSRQLFAAGLFALACTVTLYASAPAAEEAPAPRPVEGEKKVEGKGKFGGFGKGGFDKSKIDPEKLKELKEKFGGKGRFDKSKLDPKKIEELKEKFGKGKKGEDKEE